MDVVRARGERPSAAARPDRPAALRGSSRTSCGAPSAISRPWCSTAIFCAIENTTSMSCSVNSRVSPRSATMRWSRRMVSRVSRRRHAGGGLVEQQQLRIAGQCDAQLELLLVAVGQRAADRVGLVGEARASRGCASSRRGKGRRRGPRNSRLAPRCAISAACTFSKTVSLGKMLVRWNDRPMPRRQMRCGAAPVMSRPSKRDAAAVGADVAGDQVEEASTCLRRSARSPRRCLAPARRGSTSADRGEAVEGSCGCRGPQAWRPAPQRGRTRRAAPRQFRRGNTNSRTIRIVPRTNGQYSV